MTEEEKSLLFKDLCARQSYNVMINTPLFEKPTRGKTTARQGYKGSELMGR